VKARHLRRWPAGANPECTLGTAAGFVHLPFLTFKVGGDAHFLAGQGVFQTGEL